MSVRRGFLAQGINFYSVARCANCEHFLDQHSGQGCTLCSCISWFKGSFEEGHGQIRFHRRDPAFREGDRRVRHVPAAAPGSGQGALRVAPRVGE